MSGLPAAAYDAFLPQAITRARAQRDWTPADGPLPALYLSHSAPPLFDDGPWMRAPACSHSAPASANCAPRAR
ncbi:hypothetical protein [Catenuloplanes japonicus]|uniref:hypothetical protein n=1 Tax=Catenuloplanes japonicus TaxID=33876 RepID=UPI000524E5B7|nr:hypothetical protein [Catenuloplanes japonicus]